MNEINKKTIKRIYDNDGELGLDAFIFHLISSNRKFSRMKLFNVAMITISLAIWLFNCLSIMAGVYNWVNMCIIFASVFAIMVNRSMYKKSMFVIKHNTIMIMDINAFKIAICKNS